MEQTPTQTDKSPMDDLESSARMEAAIAAVEESSRILEESILSGCYEAIESATIALKFARVRFLLARMNCRT